MKLLEKLTIEKMKEKSREELEAALQEELKYVSDYRLRDLVIQLRAERVKVQKDEIKQQMQPQVDECLKFIEVLRSKDAKTKEKEDAFKAIMQFLKEQDVLLSLKLLVQTYYVLEYITLKEDVQVQDLMDIDYLMKKRLKMKLDICPASYELRSLWHTDFVDFLIEKDALLGLDDFAAQHIKSATEIEYGDLVRQKGTTATFYYYTASAYQKIYEEHKKEFKTGVQLD